MVAKRWKELFYKYFHNSWPQEEMISAYDSEAADIKQLILKIQKNYLIY